MVGTGIDKIGRVFMNREAINLRPSYLHISIKAGQTIYIETQLGYMIDTNSMSFYFF